MTLSSIAFCQEKKTVSSISKKSSSKEVKNDEANQTEIKSAEVKISSEKKGQQQITKPTETPAQIPKKEEHEEVLTTQKVKK